MHLLGSIRHRSTRSPTSPTICWVVSVAVLVMVSSGRWPVAVAWAVPVAWTVSKIYQVTVVGV